MPFPSPRDLPDPGIEPRSLISPALAGRLFTASQVLPGKHEVDSSRFGGIEVGGGSISYEFHLAFRQEELEVTLKNLCEDDN